MINKQMWIMKMFLIASFVFLATFVGLGLFDLSYNIILVPIYVFVLLNCKAGD